MLLFLRVIAVSASLIGIYLGLGQLLSRNNGDSHGITSRKTLRNRPVPAHFPKDVRKEGLVTAEQCFSPLSGILTTLLVLLGFHTFLHGNNTVLRIKPTEKYTQTGNNCPQP